MVPQKHTDELAKELPNLDLVQGYLVHKDADPSLPLQTRAENVVPGVSYASMHVSVAPLDASSSAKPEGGSKGSGSGDSSGSGSSGGSKKSGGSGKGSSSGKTKS
jgi:hypothetical protein